MVAKLLVVTRSDGSGGVERNLRWLLPSLRSCGVTVDLRFCEPPPPGPRLLTAEQAPAPLGGVHRGRWRRVVQTMALRRLLRHGDYDAVVGTGPVANALVCLARSRRGPRTIIMEQNDPFIDRRRSWNRWFGWTYRRADAVVVHTDALAEEVRRVGWYPREVVVLPNAVDPDVPTTAPLDDRPPVICAIGRLVPQKGFDDLVDAVGRLATAPSDGGSAGFAGWSLCVVGDGPERAALEQRAVERGIGERVRFVGVHPEPWTFAEESAIFVLSSRHEGFGNVILEAMAAGCAVIVSDCRFGPPEIVRHDVDGLVYPTGDAAALADAIGTLVSDPGRRRRLAEAGRRRLDDFGVEPITTRWFSVLGFDQSGSSPRHS